MIIQTSQLTGFTMRILILLSVLLLSACGGGGGGGATTGAVNTSVYVDPCILTKSTPTIPETYKGIFEIPSTNNKLPATINRSVGFKDYHPQMPYNIGCNNKESYIRSIYSNSFDKLKELGTDTVWVYNYARWEDMTKVVWTIDKNTYQIPENELTIIVEEAKKRNIKVFLAWQFHAVDGKGNEIPLGSNVDYWQMRSILLSHSANMINIAKYAERVGIAGIAVDWNAYHIPNIHEHKEEFISSMSTLIDDIKTVYSGKLTYGQIGAWIIDNRIASKIDAIHITVGATLSVAENNALTVGLVKNKMLQQIALTYYGNQLDLYPNLEVVWEIAIQSNKDYFVRGWVEDGFCVNSCIQSTYVTDFSVQAIGTEAALQAITEQRLIKTFMVDFHTSYWHTDDIVSTLPTKDNGFPNLSQSIRNKPVEKIIKQWFSK